MEEENKSKKEVSNKKAIIAIIVIIAVLIICVTVYSSIFRNKEDNCNNIIIRKYYENTNSNSTLQNNGVSGILEEGEKFLNQGQEYKGPITPVDLKPIIYIYPTEETNIEVKVGKPENLTHTYPKYEDGWKVIAKPNGDLTDLKTERNLYALYWEGINTVEPNMEEGFIVKGEDTIEFLEEKLEILGLNEREANEFIIYWLPKLENNKYNFIRFQTEKEINNNMPLKITPEPETIIRVVMEYKGIENSIKVQEQRLETPERTGYTVVEWGGTEIK